MFRCYASVGVHSIDQGNTLLLVPYEVLTFYDYMSMVCKTKECGTVKYVVDFWHYFGFNLYCYKFQSVNMQMLCTVFACMTWPDSTVCHKATRLAMSFVREVRTGSPYFLILLFAVVGTSGTYV